MFFQFEDFRSLRNEENHSMSNNFRAVQPLGDRIILYNVNAYEQFIDDVVENEELVKDIEQLGFESERFIEEAVANSIVN